MALGKPTHCQNYEQNRVALQGRWKIALAAIYPSTGNGTFKTNEEKNHSDVYGKNTKWKKVSCTQVKMRIFDIPQYIIKSLFLPNPVNL